MDLKWWPVAAIGAACFLAIVALAALLPMTAARRRLRPLANVARLTQSTASRSLRALGPKGSEWALAPALGLLEAYLNPDDGRSHVIQLSAQGRELRDRLDAIIRQSVTIAPTPRPTTRAA